jgi:hypothetical protein
MRADETAVWADIRSAATTVDTASTSEERLDHNPLPNGETFNPGSGGSHLSGELVAHNHGWHPDAASALKPMDVRSTHAGGGDLDQNLLGIWHRL